MSNLNKRIISSIIILPVSIFFIAKGSYLLIMFIALLFLIACYEWLRITNKKNYKFFGFLFLAISFYTFYDLSLKTWEIFFVILICVSTDIGGYIFGKIFKGPKLTKISPNKTYAGAIGGYLLSLIFLILYSSYIQNEIYLNVDYFIITLLLSTMSQIGDICISFFKRQSKLKNTGKLIPGHGGLLDRIDGMIFAVPMFFLIKLTGF